jgi:hypothetical protein
MLGRVERGLTEAKISEFGSPGNQFVQIGRKLTVLIKKNKESATNYSGV